MRLPCGMRKTMSLQQRSRRGHTKGMFCGRRRKIKRLWKYGSSGKSVPRSLWLAVSSVVNWRRRWHPTPVLLPGKSHWQGSLVGCSPWGREEWDMTEWLHFHFSLSRIGEGNGNPLQCSCVENRWDGGAWWAAVYGVIQSQTRLKRLSSSLSSIVTDTLRVETTLNTCIGFTDLKFINGQLTLDIQSTRLNMEKLWVQH